MCDVPLNCTERDPLLTHSPRFNNQARTHGYPIFAAHTAFEYLHSTHPHVVTHTRLQHGAFERDTPQPPTIVTLPSLQPLPPRARSAPRHTWSAPLLRSLLRSEKQTRVVQIPAGKILNVCEKRWWLARLLLPPHIYAPISPWSAATPPWP